MLVLQENCAFNISFWREKQELLEPYQDLWKFFDQLTMYLYCTRLNENSLLKQEGEFDEYS